MSAQQTIIYCLDHHCLDYGVPDKNGVFTRSSAATNHWTCAYHVFDEPNLYPAPVRMVLMKLQAGVEVTDNDIIFFNLCIVLDELEDKWRATAKNRTKEAA